MSRSCFVWQRGIHYSPISLLAFFAAVIGLSPVVYHYFEIPAQKFFRTAARGLLKRWPAAATQ
jgi:peptidoglycan/LPS O-acetylase OafA/YrhL